MKTIGSRSFDPQERKFICFNKKIVDISIKSFEVVLRKA
jgi:hypothetical protein